MTPRTHAQEIIERYRARGWTGQALTQRIAKHARLLDALDNDVADELWKSVEKRPEWW
jgi:hypothetical protein